MVSTSDFDSESSGSTPDGVTMNIKNILFGWVLQSNRLKHIAFGALIGFMFGLGAVISAALTAEFKDWAHAGCKDGWVVGWKTQNAFDWFDVAATILGGVVGCLLRLLTFRLFGVVAFWTLF